jgi:hypothetical protein
MTKITALPSDSTPTGDDYTVTVDTGSGQTKKVLLSDVLAYVNANGVPTMANIYNPYKFSAYRSTALTVTTSFITFDAEVFDTNSNYDTSTGKYTAPIAGFYQFNVAVMANMASTVHASLELWINNVQAIRLYEYTAGASTNWTFAGSQLVQLAANDYVQIKVAFSSSTGVFTGQPYTWFSGYLVSAT